MTALDNLLEAFKAHEPLVDIWRRYPDVSESEDSLTDTWACEAVTREFVEFAKAQGWDAKARNFAAVRGDADLHTWAELYHESLDSAVFVDWTARQFHNLDVASRDPKVLNAEWPLVWNPEYDPEYHPFIGECRHTGHRAQFGHGWWCDTCDSPLCDLA